MIKCTTPPSAFQVQSAMWDISLVTHGPTMENTLGPIGIIVIRVRHCGRKQLWVPTGLIINMINKLTSQQTWKQSEAPEKNEMLGVHDNITYCKSWNTQRGKEKRGNWKMQVAEPAEQNSVQYKYSARRYLPLCPATIIKACTPAMRLVTRGQTINQHYHPTVCGAKSVNTNMIIKSIHIN